MSIKIISGYSEKGGSTIALIELTNKLNQYGIDTTFYGPHQWHLNKCKSGVLNNSLVIDKEDTLICHFLQLANRPNAKKVILACHEKNLFEVGKIKQYWDEVVFLNLRHREYHHEYINKFTIIPNLKQNFETKDKTGLEKIAGIIGSFDENKQTHVSIERALADGCEKIYLYGEANESAYYYNSVKPLIDGDKVILKGFTEDKQGMYDSIGCVYHSSLSEVACLVKDECRSTGTEFNGTDATDTELEELSNVEIINRWVKVLELPPICDNQESNIIKPIIHAYFVCYNEENILPHLIEYYSTFCELITFIDNNSTDNSQSIINSYPNTKLTTFDSNMEFHDGIHIQIKNSIWQSSINVADFVIIGDTDEFIYHKDIVTFLSKAKKSGYSIFKPEGYHMIADEALELLPTDNLLEVVKYGVRTPVLDKPMIFDCNKIKSINYNFGCHSANPVGEVKWCYDNGLKMLHYKFMGINDYIYKNRIRAERLSKFNRDNGFGLYYLVSEDELRVDYKRYLDKRTKVII